MIRIYLDTTVAEKKYKIFKGTPYFFEHYTQPNLDFSKYDRIFQDIEQPEWINYECWCLKNRFGKCNFHKLSTGMKNLMNYLYFAENYKKNDYFQTIILDMSHMGPNVFYYLFKYANYYEVPFYFYNAMIGPLDDNEYHSIVESSNSKEKYANTELDPILSVDAYDMQWVLDDEPCIDAWEFIDKYYEKKDAIDEADNERIYQENKEFFDQAYSRIAAKARGEKDV
jgi:hypothetical protein